MPLFTLSKEGISEGIRCSAHGVGVGGVPLLRRISGPRDATRWLPRGPAELDAELSERYSLPVDFAAKAGGLATIAEALNAGNVALAQIATLHLRLPDPPPRAKSSMPLEAAIALATELYRSGILKGDWDPSKHPRTGTPPNPGWFTEVPKEPKPPAPSWPSSGVNEAIRAEVRRIAKGVATRALLALTGPVDFALTFLEAYAPTELNRGEERATAQFRSYFDAPKTLGELQIPNPDKLGYEPHHIVEQNAANRSKFGDAAIDDPSNIVYIPRLKHEEISAYFNSKPNKTSPYRTFRDSVADLAFQAQREEGLTVLRNVGVLK
jgi:hypothetical protein